VALPDEVKNTATLTDYSVETRYPGPIEAITEQEFRNSLHIAEAVVAWAETQL
jgi:hypothetical protein